MEQHKYSSATVTLCGQRRREKVGEVAILEMPIEVPEREDRVLQRVLLFPARPLWPGIHVMAISESPMSLTALAS